jgi:hypothetical protein
MSVFGFVISWSLIHTVPFVGVSSKFKHRKKVDLPEPEGPITAMTSPAAIVVDIPFNPFYPFT